MQKQTERAHIPGGTYYNKQAAGGFEISFRSLSNKVENETGVMKLLCYILVQR